MSSALAAALAGQPAAVMRLLAEHVDDGHGRCAVCCRAALGARPVWPCALATAAGDAHHLLRRRLGVHLEDR